MNKCNLCGENYATDDTEGLCDDCYWLTTRLGRRSD